MNWQKNVILAAIGVVVWLLVVRWSGFQAQFETAAVADQQSQIPSQQLYTNPEPVNSTLPALVDDQSAPIQAFADNQKIVTITTDVIKVSIDTLGGDLVETQLLNHLDMMED